MKKLIAVVGVLLAAAIAAPVSAEELVFAEWAAQIELWLAWAMVRPAPDMGFTYELDSEGRIAVRQRGLVRPGPQAADPTFKRLFAFADKDGDGILTTAEAKTFRGWLISRRVAFEEERSVGEAQAAANLRLTVKVLRKRIADYLDFFGAPLPRPCT